MTRKDCGTITALKYTTRPRLDFPDIVEEFDIAFQKHPTQTRSLTWDCDDIAIIDRGPLRLALGWLAPESVSRADKGVTDSPPKPGTDDDTTRPWYLVIAVGMQPGQRNNRFDSGAYEMMSRRVAERMQKILPFDAVIRGPANQPITADLLDATFELLRAEIKDDRTGNSGNPRNLDENGNPTGRGAPDGLDTPRRPQPRPGAATADPPAQNAAKAGRSHPKTPPPHRLTEGTIEDAHLLPEPPSVPLRLTIFTFSLTLMMHVPAVGAMLFVYATLREIFPAVT